MLPSSWTRRGLSPAALDALAAVGVHGDAIARTNVRTIGSEHRHIVVAKDSSVRRAPTVGAGRSGVRGTLGVTKASAIAAISKRVSTLSVGNSDGIDSDDDDNNDDDVSSDDNDIDNVVFTSPLLSKTLMQPQPRFAPLSVTGIPLTKTTGKPGSSDSNKVTVAPAPAPLVWSERNDIEFTGGVNTPEARQYRDSIFASASEQSQAKKVTTLHISDEHDPESSEELQADAEMLDTLAAIAAGRPLPNTDGAGTGAGAMLARAVSVAAAAATTVAATLSQAVTNAVTSNSWGSMVAAAVGAMTANNSGDKKSHSIPDANADEFSDNDDEYDGDDDHMDDNDSSGLAANDGELSGSGGHRASTLATQLHSDTSSAESSTALSRLGSARGGLATQRSSNALSFGNKDPSSAVSPAMAREHGRKMKTMQTQILPLIDLIGLAESFYVTFGLTFLYQTVIGFGVRLISTKKH